MATTFDHVLVPIDASAETERAVAPAVAVAEAAGIPVVLFAWSPFESDRAHLERRLVRVAGGLGDLRVRLSVETGERRALAEAIAVHAAGGVVCMATHARGAVGHLLAGSVAEDVLHETTAPLLLVGPHLDYTWTPGPLVACVDGTSVSEEILPVATDVAALVHQPVELVNVVDASALSQLPHDDVLEAGYVSHLADEAHAHTYDVLHGRDPADAIVDHARHHGAGFLAMATHGRTGLPRFVVGSVAVRVVHRAPCPVLVTLPALARAGRSHHRVLH